MPNYPLQMRAYVVTSVILVILIAIKINAI